MQKINWYVGHMAKSLNLMEKQLDKVDLVIQILDARCPNISSNPELVKLCNNKPIINIALKSDLADLSSKQQDVNYLSIAQKNFVNKVYIVAHFITFYLAVKPYSKLLSTKLIFCTSLTIFESNIIG